MHPSRTFCRRFGVRFLGALVIVYSIGCVAHAIRARSLADFTLYCGPPLVAVAAAIMVTPLVPGFSPFRMRQESKRRLLTALAVYAALLLLTFAATVVMYSILATDKDILVALGNPRINKAVGLVESLFSFGDNYALTVAVALAVGCVLFFLRLHWRGVYGLLEVVIGIGIAAHKLPSQDLASMSAAGDVLLAFLTAGVFLVVRGLDNIYQGLTGTDPDPVLSWLRKQIHRASGAGVAESPGADGTET